MKIKILDERLKKLRLGYENPGSCAIDLRACISEPIKIYPGAVHMMPSGVALDMSDHNEEIDVGLGMTLNPCRMLGAVLLPLRRLGTDRGIVLGNLVGLVNNDCQDEIIIAIWNRNQPPVMRPHEHLAHTINPMDRIAQLAFVPFVKPTFEFVDAFEKQANTTTIE